MFKTFLQFTSIILVLLSSIFLVKGTLTMSPKNILDLSGTYWGSSPVAAESYCSQKADSMMGTVLLLISFAIQLWVIFLPIYADDAVNWKGILCAVVVCFILFCVGLKVSDSLEGYFYKQVLDVERNAVPSTRS